MKTKSLFVFVLMVMILHVSAQYPVDFKNMDVQRINSDPSVDWQQFGPGGSGNNYLLYWHPTDPNTLYLGPNMGNSYRSENRGKTYVGIMDPDGPGYRTRDRGPSEIWGPEFSHQDPNFGICTIEDEPIIYFTHDKGLSWKRRNDVAAQFGEHVNTIKVDPTNDHIWYAGSGDLKNCNDFVFGYEIPHGILGSKHAIQTKKGRAATKYDHTARIWKSTNKGETWKDITPKGINPDAQITRILVNPTKPNMIFAPTTYGFYKSEDGGKTWSLKTHTGLDNDIIRSMDMYYDPVTKKVILYAIDLVKYLPNGKTIKYNGGIFKSTDEGESWTNITNDMPINKSLLESPAIKNSYYKLALGQWFGISEEKAKELYPELPEKALQSVSMIRVNPRNPNHILVVNNYKSQYTFCGGMLWRTGDGGKHWYVTLRNGKDWEGRDKASWQARNNPVSHNAHWVGQHEWENRDPYDRKAGAVVAFNCDGTSIMYQVAKVLCISNNNGDSWLENDEVETVPGNHHWVGAGDSNLPATEIVQDMRLNNFLYLCSGENSIFKTTNDSDKVRKGALAVYKISIPNKKKPEECSVSTMAIDPNNVNTLYCLHFRQAFFGKLMMSVDGGKNWAPRGTLFNPKEYGNPLRMSIKQRCLRIDPNYPNRFYCVVSKNYVDDMTGTSPGTFKAFGIYHSTDGGKNWSTVNDGLPAGNDVQKVVLDPKQKGVVWAAISGTYNRPGGLFRLEDGSSKWEKENVPNNMVSVHDIYFSQDGRMYISGGTPKGKVEDGGVWFIENGKAWKQIFPYQYTDLIRVAKYDSKLLLVSITSQYANGIKNPGIYRSMDKGKTWTKINTGNIQSDRLNALEIDYRKKGVYYCSTYGAGYYIARDPEYVKKAESGSR